MKEQPIYSSSLSLGLKDCSSGPLKSWLTSVWHAARERESNLCHASNVLTEEVWTASPRSCRAGAFLNTGFLPGAGTSCHLTDGGWEDAIRGSPGLQASFVQRQSPHDDCTSATSNWCPSRARSRQWDPGWKWTSYPLQWLTTVTVERYGNWKLARETLYKDVLKLWSSIHIYEYYIIVHTHTHTL